MKFQISGLELLWLGNLQRMIKVGDAPNQT
jgi:hypothetical protein